MGNLRVGEESNKNPFIEKFFAMVNNRKKETEEVSANGNVYRGFDGNGNSFAQCVRNLSLGSSGVDAGSI